ncbi:MAG: TonB-dependent receptor [Treponema sp.]|nr:TonB-dependent receptor [Treponema sp.]
MKKLLLFLLLPFSLFAQDEFEDYEYYFTDNEGITIIGTVQTSQQITVVDREQIENSGASDIVNLLQEKLGLNIVRHGAYGNQAGVNLRGFDSKRIAFLINGVPVNSSTDGKFDINQIDLNSIERIEVIFGGSDFKYNVSGAFGGVVNIITIRKQEQGLRFTASVTNTSMIPGEYRDRNGVTRNPHWEDLLDTQNYSVSAVYGSDTFSFSANVFANRAENHFLFTDRYNYTRRKDNNEVWDTGASVSFVWELPDFTQLILSSNVYYSDSNFPASGFSVNAGSQNDFSTRNVFMIDMPRIFHDDVSSELSLGWQFYKRDYSSPSSEVSVHDQHNLSIINRWNWYPSERLTLRSGIDYRFIGLDSTDIGNRSRHDGGLYLTIEFKPVKSLLIIPSSKVIFTSEGSENFVLIPKLGILWNITDSIAIKNNFFRSFKFPDFEELYWNSGSGSAIHGIGNPDLRPEDGWGADLGISWHITNKLRLESVFFTQWIKDSIHWFSGSGAASSGGIWRPENVGEAVFFGLDSKVNYEFPVSIGPIKKITASLSYQYILSFLLSYGYTFDSNKRIPYSPEHTISGSLEFSWSGGFLYFNGQYESSRYHDTANVTVLKPMFLLNAGVNHMFNDYITVFSVLRNILNTSYESFYDYPMPGVTLTFGLRMNLEVK